MNFFNTWIPISFFRKWKGGFCSQVSRPYRNLRKVKSQLAMLNRCICCYFSNYLFFNQKHHKRTLIVVYFDLLRLKCYFDDKGNLKNILYFSFFVCFTKSNMLIIANYQRKINYLKTSFSNYIRNIKNILSRKKKQQTDSMIIIRLLLPFQ